MQRTRVCGRIAVVGLALFWFAVPTSAQKSPRIATPAPANVAVLYSPSGVQVTWAGVASAVQYVVVRAPNAGAAGTPIGKVPAGTLSFTDQGFNAAAAYQVVAVTANGATGTSVMVSYAPPAARPVAVVDPRSPRPPPAAAPPPPPPPPRLRRITSVDQAVVRSGGIIKVHGTGFRAGVGESFMTVTGGYFGTGTPGSVSNPLVSQRGDASDTYVELATTSSCSQAGILMLHAPGLGGATPEYIGATPAIIVTCATATPAGRLVGSEATAGGIIPVAGGTTVYIQGTNLSLVTRVLDSFGTAYSFTLTGDRISLKAPVLRPGGPDFFSFNLENKLTDPVVNGTVTGTLRVVP